MDIAYELIHANGYVLRRELLAAGYDDKDIHRSTKMGALHRVRQGGYTIPEIWSSLSPEERHLLTCKVVLAKTPGRAALSHVSALVAHGIPTWSMDLSKVHILRLDGGSSRTEAGVVHHRTGDPGLTVTSASGVIAVSPAVAAVQAAGYATIESGLVSADAALNLGLCQAEELQEEYERRSLHSHMRKVRLVAKMADPGAQSVGESRLRFLCWVNALPAPQLQYAVHDESGLLIGISDMAFVKQRVLCEFDGREKYSRYLRPGQTPADVVFQEKRREDRMREASGFSMLRFTWRDLESGRDEAVTRLRHALRRAS